MTGYDGFGVAIAGGVATITLDVPGKLNRVSMLATGRTTAGCAGPRAGTPGAEGRGR